MTTIKNRYSGEVIFTYDGSLRETIEAAVKAGANLAGATTKMP